MSLETSPARLVSFPRNSYAWSWRHSCRLLAPLVLALVAQLSTGCTLVGYGVGSAHTVAPQSLGAENVRAVPVGTDVEVSYSPACSQHVPAADAPSGNEAYAATAELSVVTGAYGGVEAANLVLENDMLADRSVPEGYSPGGSPRRSGAQRITVPLACVKTIQTKSSLAPRIVGTLLGAALDVAAIALYAQAVRNIQ